MLFPHVVNIKIMVCSPGSLGNIFPSQWHLGIGLSVPIEGIGQQPWGERLKPCLSYWKFKKFKHFDWFIH